MSIFERRQKMLGALSFVFLKEQEMERDKGSTVAIKAAGFGGQGPWRALLGACVRLHSNEYPGQVVYGGDSGLEDQDKLAQGGSFPQPSMRDSIVTP
ncbi:hypothetical protein AOLI_G00133430 [Acnodon oligacanthus]